MTTPFRWRNLLFTAHVVASVGWLGTIACALVLAIAGMTSGNSQTARSAYVALELLAWFVIVPLAVASVLTGIVQSLTGTWGLFRHYWVVAKLSINVFATIVLLLYLPTLDDLADTAAASRASEDAAGRLGSPSPALHAGAALVLLLVATFLAVYKPPGLTPYGWRKQLARRAAREAVVARKQPR